MGASGWSNFFFAGWGLPFSLYVLAQLIVPFVLCGLERLWALTPVPFMAWVLISAVSASQDPHANLWPIWLIIFSPLALVYLLVLGFRVGNLPASSKSGWHGNGNAP